MKIKPTNYAIHNPRMVQMLRHAGVRVISTDPHRVTLVHEGLAIGEEPEDGMDPLAKLLLHLEPSAADGAEHMPSVEEARAMGLIED